MASDIADANQNVAGQTGDNVVIGGATYTIATDWGSGGGTGFSASHVQIVKPSWGDTDYSYRVSKLKPLPVQIFDGVQGTTGALIDSTVNALKVTGDVKINAKMGICGGQVDGHNIEMVSGIVQIVGPTFGPSGPTAYAKGHVLASQFNPVKVTGSISGYPGGYPVGVTFTRGAIRRFYGGPIGYTGFTGYRLYTSGATTNSSILDSDVDYIAVQGLSGGHAIGITADDPNGLLIQNLSSRTATHPAAWVKDSVAVEGFAGMTAIEVTGGVRLAHMPAGGSFEIRNLVASRDTVSVYSADGGTGPHVKIFGHDGTPIGVSGEALKVAVDNGSFTANVTVTPEIEVKGSTGSTGLQVRGVTSQEIVVKGPLSGGALEVSSTSGLNIRSLTTTDKVSVGGDVASDVVQLRSTLASVLTKLNTIDTNMTTLNTNINDIETVVTDFQTNALTEDSLNTNKMFNTVVKKTEQPENIISVSLSVATKGKAIASNREVHNGVYVQSSPSNTSNIMVGGPSLITSTAGGFMLEPGESIFLQVANLNKIYVKSQNGNQTVNCIGS